MIVDIFRKKYTVRRHSKQQIVRGHAVYDYEELQTLLNVQPLNPDEIQALPEGERSVKRVKAFGDYPLTAADQFSGRPGDWLFYKCSWYECKSCVERDHTPIGHFRSEFVIVPETELDENMQELQVLRDDFERAAQAFV